MLMFVWSLVANAINGARRSRLSGLIRRQLASDPAAEWALVLRRRRAGLSRFASAPSLLADNSILFQGDGFQLTLSEKCRLAMVSWTLIRCEASLGFLRQSSTATSTAIMGSLGFLNRRAESDRPVFFVATLRRVPDAARQEEAASFKMESLSIPLAWRSEELLEVLFVCESVGEFAELACHWSEGVLTYDSAFAPDALETVELEAAFLTQILVASKNKPVCVAVLEKLCLDDISAARALPQLLNPLANALLRRSASLLSRSSGAHSNSSTAGSSGRSSPLISSGLPVSLAETGQRLLGRLKGESFSSTATSSLSGYLEEGRTPSPNSLLSQLPPSLPPPSSQWSTGAEANTSERTSYIETPLSVLIPEEPASPPHSAGSSSQPTPSSHILAASPPRTPLKGDEDDFDNQSLDSPLSAYDSYSLSRERRRRERSGSREGRKPPAPRGRRDSEPRLVMASIVAAPGRRRMSLLVTPGGAPSLGLPPPGTRSSNRRQSMMPASALRNRRRSMSPMLALSGQCLEEEDDSVPSAADGVRGWRRASSFRGSSTGPVAGRRRLSSIGNILGVKAPKSAPNIVIYAGDKVKSPIIAQLRDLVARSVRANTHAVYVMSREELMSEPWKANTACLIVVDTDSLDEKGWACVEEYFRSGTGRVLFVCQNRLLSSLTDCASSKKRLGLLKLAFHPQIRNGSTHSSSLGKDFQNFMKKVSKGLSKPRVSETFHTKDLVGGYRYAISVVREVGTPLILYMQTGHKDSAGALFTDATLENLLEEGSNLIREGLERLDVPISPRKGSLALSPGALILQPHKAELMWRLCLSKGHLEGDLPIRFLDPAHEHFSQTQDSLLSAGTLPVSLGDEDVDFNSQAFFGRLRTGNRFGQNLLYVPVIESTMTAVQTLVGGGSSKYDDWAVVAECQTAGRGRGQNRWLSPEGGLYFSLPLRLHIATRLGKAPGFIQHLLTLAVAEAVSELLKNQEFPIGIKWPNDLFYLKLHKIGGVLVDTRVHNDELICVLGCGLNVGNSSPTVCINDLATGNVKLKTEEVMAESLNKLELLIAQFQEAGPSRLLGTYYRYWVHNREEVVLEDSGEKVVIRGLDAQGFLEVRSKSMGKVFSLQSNGNSFDSLKGLIRKKE